MGIESLSNFSRALFAQKKKVLDNGNKRRQMWCKLLSGSESLHLIWVAHFVFGFFFVSLSVKCTDSIVGMYQYPKKKLSKVIKFPAKSLARQVWHHVWSPTYFSPFFKYYYLFKFIFKFLQWSLGGSLLRPTDPQ